MYKRIACLLMAVLMVVIGCSCGEKTDVDVTTTEATTTTTAEKTTKTTTSKKGKGSTAVKTTASTEEKTTATTTKKANSKDDGFEYAELRDGLDNTYAKLIQENELTIAYIGGSVTAGASASPASQKSFRALTTAWFKEQFPNATINEINMGIGSAGSKLAAYYVKSEVAAKKPDLVFVECAINDYIERKAVPLEAVSIQYETIIRQLRTADPTCDIVALYTTNAAVTARKQFYDEAGVQDEVAAHYGVLSINIGRQLRMKYRLLDSEDLASTAAWGKFFADDVHPNTDGHRFYADCIIDVLKTLLLTNAADKTPTAVANHEMPAAKNANLLMDAQYIKADKIDLSSSTGWAYDAEKGYIYADKTNSELVFTFTGTTLNFHCSGLPWGDVERASYSIDGGEWVTLSPCMIRAVPIVAGLSKGTHTIRFKCGFANPGQLFTITAAMVS